MSKYRDDLSQERKPKGLIPEGNRLVRVLEMIESVSKGGNKMFTCQIEDLGTKEIMPVWLLNEPKKRWLLKSLLSACEVAAAQDGIYEWDTSDVIGKTVVALIQHEEKPWINREGVEVIVKNAKVLEFFEATNTAAETSQPVDFSE